MGRVHETVKTVNSTARTLMAGVLMAVAGIAGYQGYEVYNEPKLELEKRDAEIKALESDIEETRTALKMSKAEVDSLQVALTEKTEQVEKLDASLRLLKYRRRLARLNVLEQNGDKSEGTLKTKVAFVETNNEGFPIGEPQEFEILGDMIYIEYLVAKFDDSYIEAADLERGTAICLFQRIFGENQEPNDGFRIDRVGTRPIAYERGQAISEFEQKIWNDFWTIANDPDTSAELGIRAAHGNAASIRVRPKQSYQLDLRATGEFALKPITNEL